MHTYSIDSDRRLKVLGLLGALSLIVIQLGEGLLSRFVVEGYTAAVLIPSFGAVFAGLFLAWNRYLWRWKVFQRLGIVKTPDLNGEWEGYLKTSYNGEIPESAIHVENDEESEYTKVRATLTITQQWWRMQVDLSTEQSSSMSEGGTLLVEDSRWPTLSYQYENNPGMETPDAMRLHYGTANLEYNPEGKIETLEGVYYTGPKRENHGGMKFSSD
ncbi:hypothetical protein [Halomarina rubra]|uniref:CD-NTase-associated protein 15 domain-containing protein n=1 Tax=Halomarina rubra TaxID=2071873 RepID=A0ABD6AU83_9EURY|nr:hypothetical protein [Halomarina rubra]